ncbi:glycine/betaine ABC transporter ATP-binding protein [Paenibacillus sp. E194]|uniref:Quaternary amine transport ATP-binding protein n=1 Tax=Paenibacillus alvei TS-15 TaxID=1117108 RepID=S9SRS3_PAEAL|nr:MULTISPECIES: betaine/proline/choline family ABC transporter ATP-binding protein [Paenibacillus]EPY08417.1 glycine betaine/L-proline ABC transporter ATPase subunit [Paenibacillus alvei TS-15]KJB87540.1 glycine/betaine ABC transporter ATP-binding protein [Paenibacillus sp. E194]
MIQFQHVNKVYEDGFQALKDINLEFKKGELTVLIGPSGCGKSTTMKMINRLMTPSSGTILIDGKDVSSQNPVELRRNIGYVIQNIGLFPHMTIGNNIAVVPRLNKWEKEKIDPRVDELMRLVNLDPEIYRNRYPSELSGGQQQRIGVARAFAADPDVILMDEPFSALDPISREQLQDELIRLQQDFNKTIIFVTHDMDEAIKIADTIVLMKDGVVVQTGSPEAILRHPANDFVRTFIGQKRLESESPIEIPTVDEVMVTTPATAFPNRGLAEAIKMMEHRKVDSLFIVDRAKKLQGIVSIYNVLDQYGEEGKTVKDVMKPIGYSVPAGTPLPDALNIMNDHRLTNLAVIDDAGTLVGLITRGSVVKHLSEVYPAVVDKLAKAYAEEA